MIRQMHQQHLDIKRLVQGTQIQLISELKSKNKPNSGKHKPSYKDRD